MSLVTTDFDVKRQQLVEELRRLGISNVRVLEALNMSPRHLFVPPEEGDRAYENCALTIGYGQTISQPYIVALMLAKLDLQGCEKVLEIGTGSGYQTALLSTLAARVYTMEYIPELAEQAAARFKQAGYSNVVLRLGDGSEGWKEEAPFEAIIVSAASPDVPLSLLQQVAEGGKMIVPIGDEREQDLICYSHEKDFIRKESLGRCVFVKLVGKEGWDA